MERVRILGLLDLEGKNFLPLLSRTAYLTLTSLFHTNVDNTTLPFTAPHYANPPAKKLES
jgi:hypothetical protein